MCNMKIKQYKHDTLCKYSAQLNSQLVTCVKRLKQEIGESSFNSKHVARPDSDSSLSVINIQCEFILKIKSMK